MRICTIIARNYLGQAEVLAESFREQHPDGAVSVLVVDDRERLVESRPGLYDVVRPEELPIPRFEGMAAMYDVTELCTAVKPWLLRHLLDGGEPVAYFDPDICFYGRVDELAGLAAEHQIVLIPHLTRPFPDDRQTPDDAFVLAAGAYNLGFIALGPGDSSARLLDWWSARLRFDCVNDIRNGYFVDQRWFDLVPGMFPLTALVRDPGMNVAYWNLHERGLRVDAEGRCLVGDAPLKFFHFSGFDPRYPHELSRHQSRFPLADVPVVADLCSDYAERVRARSPGFGVTKWPFDALADGRRLSPTLRRLYREGERDGAFELSPFTVEGTNEFIAWLADVAPDAPGRGINRYWTYVYRIRPDLQHAFPALAGADGERYLDWIARHAPVDEESRDLRPRLPGPALVAAEQDAPATAAQPQLDSHGDPTWGVNVCGYLESEIGVGEAARATISALDAARIPLLPVHGPWRPDRGQGHPFTTFGPQDAVFPVNLMCVNADMIARWLAEAGTDFRAGRYTIGLWWWEVTAWPEQWREAFDHVDEVWVATEHIQAALAPVATVPVTKITLPVRAPTPRRRSRADLGLPEGFLFLFMFDYRSVAERKNPLDTIEAFSAAFAPGEGAKLAIKCVNHDANPVAHARLHRAAARHPDVRIVEGYISAADKNSMIASADCYVSLHRSEGYGLTLAESLMLGKPVIATRYSGNLDFMSPSGSWLVDAEMVPIGPGNDPYPAHGEWAQPDVAQAGRYMREIFDDPAAARARAARGAEAIRRTHSPAAAGATMSARLELLRSRRERWPTPPPQPPPTSAPNELQATSALLARGPVSSGLHRGRARALARHSALRVMKPYTAFEQQVDHTLLAALRALDERIESTRLVAEAHRGARFGKQIGALAAALRELEVSIAELSAQVGGASDASAEWFHGLGESLRGLERHVSALESDAAESLRGLERHLAALETDVGALTGRIGQTEARLGQTEGRLEQLETPQLVSDRARFVSLAALHRAHTEIGARPGAGSRTDRLEGYELRGFSQNGEDGVLAEILSRIGAENRFFVEFGIESGREGNCVYLADVAGWDGLFIEADPHLYPQLSERYGANERIQTVHALVTPANVEQLFADADVPESLDILSVDVDGADYWIWDALRAYRPRVVVIEYNSALPAATRLVQPPDHGSWEGTSFQGASLGAMVSLGTEKGYRLVHTDTSGVNAFFVREELAAARFPAPESIPRREPNYFQIGYHHPPDLNGHRYLNLDTGELVHAPANGSQPT